MLEDTPSICKSLSSVANTAARLEDGNEEREGGEEVESDRFRKEVRRQPFQTLDDLSKLGKREREGTGSKLGLGSPGAPQVTEGWLSETVHPPGLPPAAVLLLYGSGPTLLLLSTLQQTPLSNLWVSPRGTGSIWSLLNFDFQPGPPAKGLSHVADCSLGGISSGFHRQPKFSTLSTSYLSCGFLAHQWAQLYKQHWVLSFPPLPLKSDPNS